MAPLKSSWDGHASIPRCQGSRTSGTDATLSTLGFLCHATGTVPIVYSSESSTAVKIVVGMNEDGEFSLRTVRWHWPPTAGCLLVKTSEPSDNEALAYFPEGQK